MCIKEFPGVLEQAWTRSLIPNIKDWMTRRHGKVIYHLTQLQTGNGSFGEYLQRIKLVQVSKCGTCAKEDDAEHTLLRCSRCER